MIFVLFTVADVVAVEEDLHFVDPAVKQAPITAACGVMILQEALDKRILVDLIEITGTASGNSCVIGIYISDFSGACELDLVPVGVVGLIVDKGKLCIL